MNEKSIIIIGFLVLPEDVDANSGGLYFTFYTFVPPLWFIGALGEIKSFSKA